MNNNKLVINPDKTHMMVMGTKKSAQLRQQVSMRAGNFIIKPTETEKLLGGSIHQSLKWNQHITDNKSSQIRQLTSQINGYKKIARNATFGTRLIIANGAVSRKLVYLITVWGGAQQYLFKALQVQQLTAARTVCRFNSWGWSKRRLLIKVGWMSVRQLVFFTLCYKLTRPSPQVCQDLSMQLSQQTILMIPEVQAVARSGLGKAAPPPPPSSIGQWCSKIVFLVISGKEVFQQ